MTTRKGRDKGTEACEFLTFWGCFKTGSSALSSYPSLPGASHQVLSKLCDFRKYLVHSPEVTGHAAEHASAVHGSINRKSLLLPASELPGFIRDYSDSYAKGTGTGLGGEFSELPQSKSRSRGRR